MVKAVRDVTAAEVKTLAWAAECMTLIVGGSDKLWVEARPRPGQGPMVQ